MQKLKSAVPISLKRNSTSTRYFDKNGNRNLTLALTCGNARIESGGADHDSPATADLDYNMEFRS